MEEEKEKNTEADLASYFSSPDLVMPKIDPTTHSGQGLSYAIIPRLIHILKKERKDVAVVLVYSAIVGLFSLVIPLASQGIVNAVSLGVLTTQLSVLVIAAGAGLTILGLLSVVETYIVEILRQRIFVRAAFEIGYRVPRIQPSSLHNEYAPELVNRFFDVMTVQKVLGKFLLDGVSAVLTALAGLLLLAVYHPFFLLFDILLILFAVFLVFILSRGALPQSIMQSKKKFAMAHWLEEIARCLVSFKLYSTPEFVSNKVDKIASEYVKYRRKYFNVVLRQLGAFAIFRAVALAGILGIGGVLVIDRQISIGQLVAAELVIFAMLSAFEKIVMSFEDYYDLLTAVDKVSHITDKPLESQARNEVVLKQEPASLQLKQVRYSYAQGIPIIDGVSMEIPAGARVSIVGKSASGKSTLAKIIARLYDYDSGLIAYNGYDIRRIELQTYRERVGMVFTSDEIFDGTIEENILMGRKFKYEDIIEALRLADLYDEVFRLPNGLQTVVASTGKTLSSGMKRRIMFARAVVNKPSLLILDDSFSEIEEYHRIQLLDAIYADPSWTIIDISHDAEQLRRADKVFVVSDGKIIEQGPPRELVQQQNSYFTSLFPTLAQYLKSVNPDS